ncbi:hypothetical protein [Actimicrobium sp. CCI2.3]|uniref:hypothetical protein n=1 Tax=Actimicrobium sp. CCI2.3 TaxID=3048616 RepID=UPI002AB535A8|nr:hypothetical protein [Actimicrobium sp. CCI2.3]MDY7574749.1 hypothetical protein [Actimicrobium sp. CCI2.3]MEB0020290.1 hypothetical protein [Actimicrobium sp. CCI2.3]
MLELLNPPLRLGISGTAVSLLRLHRWNGAPGRVLAEQSIAPSEDGSFAALASALETLFASTRCQGASLQVVIADDLARFWQVTPPPQALRLSDLDAAIAVRFHALYGESLAGWTMQADRAIHAPFLAVAMPQTMLDVVQRSAKAHKLAIVGNAPQFIHCWNRWCKHLASGAWFGVVHGTLLTLGVVDGARLCALRTLSLPTNGEADWLAVSLAREALLLGLAAPTRLQVCGALPTALLGTGPVRCEILDGAGRQGQTHSLAGWLALSGARW